MKRVLSVVLAAIFVFIVTQPAMVTKTSASGVAVTYVKLNSTNLLWAVGWTGKFLVTVLPENVVDKSVSWKSSDTKVVTVDSTGAIKAVGVGKATITCASKANAFKKATCTITVTLGKPVAAIKFSTGSIKWPVGMSSKVAVNILPSDAKNRKVIWKSSNTKVATVDSTGKVKAVGLGKATITCTSASNALKKATCSVTVGKPVKSIKISSLKENWMVGESEKFKVDVLPSDAICKDVIWKSSDPSIASVYKFSVVVAKKAGNATLTCSSKYDSKIMATYNIKVATPEGNAVGSYSYDPNGEFFYVEDNPWQRKYGFNKLYDKGAPMTAMYYNTVRLQFTYNKLDWMVQLWKGQYGYAFIGSEMGIYTRPEKRLKGSLDHYNCATDDQRQVMEMSLYNKDKWLFTRTEQLYWWATGFVQGYLDEYGDRTQLTMVSKIKFDNIEMTKLCVEALLKNGFEYADTVSVATPDTFTVQDTCVYFNWSNIGQPGLPKDISKIIFYADGGSETVSQKGSIGEKLNPPKDPTKESYAFAGWEPKLPETYPAGGLTVTALWTEPGIVTFDSKGGTTVDTLNGAVGQAVTAPPDPTKEGYIFTGWKPVLPAIYPLDGLTVTAQWAKPSTITFNSKGGTAVAPLSGAVGLIVKAPSKPTKENFTFVGWNPALPVKFPSGGLSVEAKWKPVETQPASTTATY